MTSTLMYGPAIDGIATMDIREVPEADVVEYEAAGFQRLESKVQYDWVNDSGFRYTEWGTNYANATIEAPIAGAVDGGNAAFTFSGPIAACCLNGRVFNQWGTLDGSTFTFDSAPAVGDNVTGLVGVT